MRLVYWVVGFTVGNFIVEAFQSKRDWKNAVERSFLQAAALAFAYVELS